MKIEKKPKQLKTFTSLGTIQDDQPPSQSQLISLTKRVRNMRFLLKEWRGTKAEPLGMPIMTQNLMAIARARYGQEFVDKHYQYLLAWALVMYESGYGLMSDEDKLKTYSQKQAAKLFKLAGFTTMKPTYTPYLRSCNTSVTYYLKIPGMTENNIYRFQSLFGVPGYTSAVQRPRK